MTEDLIPEAGSASPSAVPRPPSSVHPPPSSLVAELENHYIVCGAGLTGWYIIRELMDTRRPFVAIDLNEETLRDLAARGPAPCIAKDATEESTLAEARLDRAVGLVASLSSDRDNLFLILTARHLNPGLRIIARGYELSAQEKLKRAGADSVIYPNHIGGRRMVSEMVRPAVVGFLDQMVRDTRHAMRFEEAVVGRHSQVVGKTLEESGIRQATGLLVIGARHGEGRFIYNPSAETVLHEGMALVVLGAPEQVTALRGIAENRPLQ
ncbi:MAG TPA: NAD-binding protein [Armatimonadota bacterium]|nr:NAD-binding protein [Armatimonadota bacterium]